MYPVILPSPFLTSLLPPSQPAQSSGSLVHSHAPSTDLEREVAAILHASDAVERPGQRLTRGEEQALNRAFGDERRKKMKKREKEIGICYS